MKNPHKEKVFLGLMMSLTLGLAPFFPEPHIIGKIRWILGGAEGMQLMDWGDTLMHGVPWIYLVISLILFLTYKPKKVSYE